MFQKMFRMISFSVLGLGLFLAVSDKSFSQQVPPAQPWVITSGQGKYEFFHYDKTVLNKGILDELSKRSQQDRDYFLKAVQEMEQGFEELLTTTIYNNDAEQAKSGLVTLSSLSQTDQNYVIPAKDFAVAVNRYNLVVQTLQSRLRRLTALTDGGLPSQTQALVDESGNKIEIQGYGNINFDGILDFYESRMDAIQKQVSTLPFRIRLVTGTLKLHTGIDIPRDLFWMTPEAARQEFQTNILPLKGWSRAQRRDIDAFTFYVRDMVQEFITKYGTTERWRSLNAAAIAQRDLDWKQMVDGLWLRSYIRANFTVPLGAIGINYKKRAFKIDMFTVSTEALSKFREEVCWSDREQLDVEDDLRYALATADARTVRILDNGDASFIDKANSFFTWVGGKRNLADAQQMILRLLAADLYEDRLITKPNGADAIIEQYRNRYYSTEDNKKYYQSLENTYFPEGDDAAKGATSEFAGDGRLRKYIEELGFLMTTKQKELELARYRELEIMNFLKSPDDDKTKQQQKDRRKRLRGE